MPDFFEGRAADISWYPPDNKEKEKKLGEFFQTQAAPPKTLPRIPKIIDELSKSKGIEKWAIIGFCWGGKVTQSPGPKYGLTAHTILDCQSFFAGEYEIQGRRGRPSSHGCQRRRTWYHYPIHHAAVWRVSYHPQFHSNTGTNLTQGIA